MKKITKYLLTTIIFSSFIIVKDVSAIVLNKDDIGNSTYVIGKAIYTRDELGDYKGRLTTRYIMLAAKTIEGSSIEDMIILYKNAKGEWINGLDSSIEVVIPDTFEIHYKNGQKYPEEKKYTVTFNTDGGSEITSKEINEGEKVTKPADPTKEGYKFVKWQLNGEDYDFEKIVTGDIELKAVWEKIVYTIKKVPVDSFSPDVFLKVYADGKEVKFNYIKYNDITICSLVLPAVNAYDINGITIFSVTLENGTIVQATVEE